MILKSIMPFSNWSILSFFYCKWSISKSPFFEVILFEATHFKKWPFEVTPLFRSDRNPTIFTYALAQQAPNFRGYNFFQPNECHPRIQLYQLCPNDFT